jgi:hypothetical protein
MLVQKGLVKILSKPHMGTTHMAFWKVHHGLEVSQRAMFGYWRIAGVWSV